LLSRKKSRTPDSGIIIFVYKDEIADEMWYYLRAVIIRPDQKGELIYEKESICSCRDGEPEPVYVYVC
jgi:hypothetical protein